MTNSTAPPVRVRHLEALRASLLHSLGLRRGAYPSAMPMLVARGLIQGRRLGETAWFLTDAGRALVREQSD